ncbi:GDP-mannose 4,6-dehydratase [Marinomonas sp. RS-M-Aa-14]|uniref:GDP-mannose 4,6-dehydratase n=1 Tax=Marinomonas sp. RS-M-Aa-14 TaxID=3241169 RepID=UPI00390CA57C
MRRVLVTGSNGFTGRYVVTELKRRGYDVVEIVRKKNSTDQVECDLSDKAHIKYVFSKIQPDYIIHLAALSFVGHHDARAFYDVNLFSTLNILEACNELDLDISKIIISSSANIYGNPDVELISEDQPPSPVNHYAMSKLAMEHMCKLWFDKLPILITRPFNYTGVGQDLKFLIPKIVDHFRRNEKTIELGNLDVYRDFSDVRDISSYYVDLLESDVKSEFVNLCSGSLYSLFFIVEKMEEIADYKIEVNINPSFVRSNEIKKLCGDNSKLMRIINHPPVYCLEDTLKKMFDA